MATITRGLVQKSDTLNYDGITQTGTRPDASGGTVTGLTIDADVDVLEVFGASTNYTVATVKAATDLIGAADATLVFRPGTWVIDDNLTIDANLTVLVKAGAVFAVSAGKTLTLSGHVIREAATWKSGSGTVTVAAGTTDADLAALNVSGAVKFSNSSFGAVEVNRISTSAAPAIKFSNDDGIKGYIGVDDFGTFEFYGSSGDADFITSIDVQGRQANRGTSPYYALIEDDATTDEGKWRTTATGDELISYAANDANSLTAYCTITRTLGVVDKVTFVADLTASTFALPTATTTNLEDNSHAVNTSAAKVEGSVFFNTTTNAPVYAVGNADGDVWNDATGSTAHTPV